MEAGVEAEAVATSRKRLSEAVDEIFCENQEISIAKWLKLINFVKEMYVVIKLGRRIAIIAIKCEKLRKTNSFGLI